MVMDMAPRCRATNNARSTYKRCEGTATPPPGHSVQQARAYPLKKRNNIEHKMNEKEGKKKEKRKRKKEKETKSRKNTQPQANLQFVSACNTSLPISTPVVLIMLPF